MLKRVIIGRVWLYLCLLALLGGCAALKPGFESPDVKVTGLEVLPSERGFLGTRIAVDLLVSNPNSSDLSVQGMSYSMALEDYKLLSGVTDQVPVLTAYRETPLRLVLSVDLIEGLRMFEHLLRGSRAEMEYTFAAKLDLGWQGSVRINQRGTLGTEDISTP